MRKYELIFIVRQDSTPNQVENLAQAYAEIIRTHGGSIEKTEFCGLRNLAYRINKNKKGHYVLMNLLATPAGIAEVERQMKISEEVLRCLTVKVEELDNNPSHLMQHRGFREDRNRLPYEDDYFSRNDVPAYDAQTPAEVIPSPAELEADIATDNV